MKKKTIALAVLGAIAVGTLLSNTVTTKANGSEIANSAANKITSNDIDYIKRTSKKEISEHWRDVSKGQEKSKTYNLNGELINSIYVVDSGKRVYSVGGSGEAYTWILPEEISNENNELLKRTLLDQIKLDLESKYWKFEGAVNEDDKTLQKLSTSKKGAREIVFVDESTGFVTKKEVYIEDNGKMELSYIEEYKKLASLAKDEFDTSFLNAKEIISPTSPEGVKKN